jgi:hypothetical protein
MDNITSLEGKDNSINDLLLDDEHAHILVEYDQDVIPLHCLTEAIESAGAEILEVIVLREGPEGNKSVFIRLGTKDARNAILNLSKYPLIRVEGYNSEESLSRNQSRKRQ